MMDAYAVFAGGGVRGAALAGAMEIAQKRGVHFIGYGGTSAGAIVALLACAGYSGSEIGTILVDTDFSTFIDDGGNGLARFHQSAGGLLNEKTLSALLDDTKWWQNVRVKLQAGGSLPGVVNGLKKLSHDYGLSGLGELRKFLNGKLKLKIRKWKDKPFISFKDLREAGLPLLKVVASDVTHRIPVIFEETQHGGMDVVTAVIASATYPFAFDPIQFGDTFLVDGGLASNLPVFLFEQERTERRRPVFAFDLVQDKTDYKIKNFFEFCSGVIDTALGSGDVLMRHTLGTIQYIPINTGKAATLDFKINKRERKDLFDRGKQAASEFFDQYFPQVDQVAEGSTELVAPRTGTIGSIVAKIFGIAPQTEAWRAIQAVHCPPALIEHLLGQIKREMYPLLLLPTLRAAIWLPTNDGTLQAVYVGVGESWPERDVSFGRGVGWIGQTWERMKPLVTDLEVLPPTDKSWKLRRQDALRIGGAWKTVFSFPIFDPHSAEIDKRGAFVAKDVIGVLSVDSSRSARSFAENVNSIVNLGLIWADIMAKMLVN